MLVKKPQVPKRFKAKFMYNEKTFPLHFTAKKNENRMYDKKSRVHFQFEEKKWRGVISTS